MTRCFQFCISVFLMYSLVVAALSTAEAKTDLSGFVPIFDGKSLSGWHKLTEGGAWRVLDGAIVGDQYPEGHGGLLVTDKHYSDYELYAEVLTTYPLDTGLFLRILSVREHFQLTIDYRPTGEIGAIYGPFPTGGGFFQHCYEGITWWDPNEYNPVRVRIEGAIPRIQVWIRDNKVMDYQDTPVNGRPRFPRAGPVGIQVHPGKSWGKGSKVSFRNLMIKELNR